MSDHMSHQTPEGPISKDVHPTNVLLPEIVEMILHYCDFRTLAVCARLSRSWKNESYRILYHTPMDVRPLLRLFGNLDPHSGEPQFTSFHPEAWTRFQSLSKFVQVYRHTLSTSAIADLHLLWDVSCISVNPNRMSLFPNLHILEFTLRDGHSVNALKAFLNPTIHKITLRIDVSHHYLPLVADLLQHYTPNLATLYLYMQEDRAREQAEVVASLSRALEQLPHIHNLTLHAIWMHNPRVWAVLGTFPRLYRLERWADDILDMEALQAHICVPAFSADSFPSLQQLELALPVNLVADTLQTLPSSLTTFGLLMLREGGRWFKKEDDWLNFLLHCILDELPRVTSLSLTFLEERTSRPLIRQSFPHLKKLVILVDYPLGLNDNDFVELVTNLPNLTTLELGPDPIRAPPVPDETETFITLNGVEAAARAGSKIEHLALYIDVILERSHAQRTQTVPPTPYSRFTHLQTFNVGMSSLWEEDIPTIAQWLSGIVCPSPATQIISKEMSERPYLYEYKDSDLMSLEAMLGQRWSRVNEAIKQIRQHVFLASASERDEIERLRRRLRELGDGSA